MTVPSAYSSIFARLQASLLLVNISLTFTSPFTTGSNGHNCQRKERIERSDISEPQAWFMLSFESPSK